MIRTNCIFTLLILTVTIMLTEVSSEHFGPVVEDPNLPKYYAMSVDSLNQYEEENGLKNHHAVVKVIKVVTSVVAGLLTTIDFYASKTVCKSSLYELVPPNCPLDNVSPLLLCQSQLWSRPWLNKREIIIECSKAI
ncbi:cystatin cpi-1-like [Danaus plexippus]|uniref:cystatin cpi-1-like n=1 Tax=Danaus plexippus TaxID=13037 RepID=UPI002AB1F542|nr:cystatin cpi-1-like [Danaus plexippus]